MRRFTRGFVAAIQYAQRGTAANKEKNTIFTTEDTEITKVLKIRLRILRVLRVLRGEKRFSLFLCKNSQHENFIAACEQFRL